MIDIQRLRDEINYYWNHFENWGMVTAALTELEQTRKQRDFYLNALAKEGCPLDLGLECPKVDIAYCDRESCKQCWEKVGA